MEHGSKDNAFYAQKHKTPCTVVITSLLVSDKPIGAPAFVKRVFWVEQQCQRNRFASQPLKIFVNLNRAQWQSQSAFSVLIFPNTLKAVCRIFMDHSQHWAVAACKLPFQTKLVFMPTNSGPVIVENIGYWRSQMEMSRNIGVSLGWHIKSHTPRSWGEQYYPGATWSSIEDDHIKGRLFPSPYHERKEVSLSFLDQGEADQANWTLRLCSSWIWPKTLKRCPTSNPVNFQCRCMLAQRHKTGTILTALIFVLGLWWAPRSFMSQHWPQYWYQFLYPCPKHNGDLAVQKTGILK